MKLKTSYTFVWKQYADDDDDDDGNDCNDEQKMSRTDEDERKLRNVYIHKAKYFDKYTAYEEKNESYSLIIETIPIHKLNLNQKTATKTFLRNDLIFIYVIFIY